MSHLTSRQILQLLDHAVDAAEESRWQAHLFECLRCREELALQQAIARNVRQQPLHMTSPRFTAAVMRRARLHERQSLVLRFLMKHGTIMALVLAAITLGYGVSMLSFGRLESIAHELEQPANKMQQYYTDTHRLFLNQMDELADKMRDAANEENAKLLLTGVLIIFFLAVLDRFVLRPLAKMRL